MVTDRVVGEENGAFIEKSFSQEFVQARVEVECVRFQVRNAERNTDWDIYEHFP